MDNGERFEGYALHAKIAEGGMAEVFRAVRRGHLGIDREVCIKRIRKGLCAEAGFRDMFIDEARIASMLRQSNIVAVEHFGVHDETLFMVMEWVHGCNAAELLARAAPAGRGLPADAVAFVLGETLAALAYAHAKRDRDGAWLRIVHRDVSPQNLMISYSGEVKLADFGIAKASSRITQTAAGLIKGKVVYMAPEQALGDAIDHRTDLFALGVVGWHLLTGRLPFGGAGSDSYLHAVVAGRRPALRDVMPDVPEDLRALLEGLLVTRAEERFQSAEEAREVLLRGSTLATGERSLRELVRRLCPEDAHSTVRGVPVRVPEALALAPTQVEAVRVPVSGSDATQPARPAARPDDDEATVAARPRVLPETRPHGAARRTVVEQVPVEATPGPVAVVDEAQARRSLRPARRGAGTSTVVVTAAVGALLGAVVTGVAQRRDAQPVAAARAATTPAATSTAAVVAVGPNALGVVHAARLSALGSSESATPAVQPTRDAGALAVQDASAPTVRPARLEVVVLPWGWSSVDGGPRRNQWSRVTLPPGTHTIRAWQDHLAPQRRTVTLRPGETREVVIDLREPAPAR